MCMGIGLEESFGLSVSSIGNVGPGLGVFGPAFSWSALPDLAKWLLSFMMLIGRLELFGVLLLLTPSFGIDDEKEIDYDNMYMSLKSFLYLYREGVLSNSVF